MPYATWSSAEASTAADWSSGRDGAGAMADTVDPALYGGDAIARPSLRRILVTNSSKRIASSPASVSRSLAWNKANCSAECRDGLLRAIANAPPHNPWYSNTFRESGQARFTGRRDQRVVIDICMLRA